MHEHDQEIIMALAEGTLDTANAAAVAAELEACPECLRDLELQRIAISSLNEAPAAYLSATESARLHGALRQELAIAAPAVARPRTQAAWGRWAGFAVGAAAVFLGAVLLLPNVLGGEDDDTAALSDVSEESADAATNGPETLRLESTTGEAPLAPDAGGVQIGDDTAADGTDTAEDSAVSETTAAASSETTEAMVDFGLDIFVGDLNESLRSEVIDMLAAVPASYVYEEEEIKALHPEFATCLEGETLAGEIATLGLSPGSEAHVIGLIVGTDQEERLLIAYVPPDIDDTVLVALTVPSCEIFQTLP